jgi:hypothetical protein
MTVRIWLATITFYTALHAIQVVLVQDGARAVDHFTRNEVLRGQPRYTKIYPDYKALYDTALAVRYDCKGAWISSAEVRTELIGNRLSRLEHGVIRLSKSPIHLQQPARLWPSEKPKQPRMESYLPSHPPSMVIIVP